MSLDPVQLFASLTPVPQLHATIDEPQLSAVLDPAAQLYASLSPPPQFASTLTTPELHALVDDGLPIPGPPGPEGPAGPQGVEGPAGPQGEQGIQGPIGPEGPEGPPGTGIAIQGSVPSSGDLPASGAPGDAWVAADTGHLWVWDEDTGTWVDAGVVQGPPGPAGEQGPQGIQGVPGTPGATGPKGDTGDAGATGAQGPAGATGAPGATGPEGPQGPAGPTGSQGPQGIPGIPSQVQDEGTPLTARTALNFVGAGVTASDDAANGRTVITIPGGGAGGAVDSVFTRTGAVVAATGDYTAAQVTNAVSALGTYADPAWITSLAYSKLSGVPSSFTPSAHVHAASDTTSGVFNVARLASGTATATKYVRGDGAWSQVAYTELSGVPSSFTPSAHVHAAADVTSGVFAVARLGSGTPSSSNYLRGDGAWTAITASQVSGAVPNTVQVIAGTGLGGGGALSGNVTLTANVQTVFGRTGAVVLTTADITGAGGVPDTRQVIAGTGLTGGGALSGNVTLNANIAGIQTPWLQNIEGNGFLLSNVPNIAFITAASIGADSSQMTISAGVIGQALLVSANGLIRFTSGAETAFVTGASERMRITAGGDVGVGNTMSTIPGSAGVQLVVGSVTAATPGHVTVSTNTSSVGGMAGTLNFANYNTAGAEKRIASIAGVTDGTTDSGYLSFFSGVSGALTERMRVTSAGAVQIGAPVLGATITVPSDGAADSGAFVISTRSLGTLAERVRVSAAGSFGIGKTPVEKLDVAGNVSLGATGDCYQMFSSAGALRWRIYYKSSNDTIAFHDFIGREQLILYPNGEIQLPFLSGANPGAGSKKLWYDPADGNRVKYAV